MAYDGVQNNNRVDPLTLQKINAKVIDNVLNGRTYFSRLMGMGKPFHGKTMDFPVKLTSTSQGEFFTGLETLSASSTDTLGTLSYAHTGYEHPVVFPMLEAFANSGPEQVIDLQVYKMEETIAEMVQQLGSIIYTSTGTANQPLGLAAIVDDASNVATIGGLSRSTYTNLKATVTASGGSLTLAKLATLWSTITAGGVDSEQPNILLTTKTIFDLYETLLQPTVRASYSDVGYNQLPSRGNSIVKPGQLQGGAGFNALAYRGMPMISDDAATSGVLFMLNERYINWYGRTTVPSGWDGELTKASVGSQGRTTEGVMAQPPKDYGWFYQPPKILPNQAGMLARYYIIGQTVCTQFRRQGKLTGITSA